MGLVFYYLFHYLFFLLLLLPLFLPGLKVNINQQHLCCVLLFMLQSYALAVAAALSEEAHVQSSAHTRGLFLKVLVVLLCNVPELSCGPNSDIIQRMFHFKMPRCWDLLL